MTPATQRAIQTFEVSLKAFIVRDGRVLVVQEADTGYWELPGGRIDVGEERLAHVDILQREIAEELGPAFRVALGGQVVTWVRQRPTDQVFQFLVARVGQHVSGALMLSAEHAAHLWVTQAEAARLDFPPLSEYSMALDRLWALVNSAA